MKTRKELPTLLLALAVGCGGRSALDAFGGASASNGDDATVGGPVEGGPSSSGGASGSSSGSGSGSSGGNTGSTSGGGSGSGGSSACGSPSCNPGGLGMTNCGPSGECCCTSLEVTGGTFYRTYKNSGKGPTGEANPATVTGFRLDKYDVTVGRFRRFVAAWDGGSGWTPTAGSGKHTHLHGGRGLVNGGTSGTYEPGWQIADNVNIAPTDANLSSCTSPSRFPTQPPFTQWTTTAGSQENRPVNCVNWYEAYAFCIWDGGFLPSKAEWEYAAAGGSEQREYPWGSAAPGTASTYAIYDCYYGGKFQGMCLGGNNIAPVGTPTRGAGRWGQLDLVGNMEQWTLDLDGYPYYVDPCSSGGDCYVNPCVDCALVIVLPGSLLMPQRVFAGGYFAVAALVVDGYISEFPSARDNSYGIRCARAP